MLRGRRYLFLKRFIDLFISGILLILLMPFLILTAIIIRLDSPGSYLYIQPRLGKNGRIFRLYKFRSMKISHVPDNTQIFQNSSEVTKVGSIIRRLKIDELPQLVNVFRGDMSLVGPRPCLPSLRQDFNSDGERRLMVNPGITGLAQVSGNIYLEWPQRWRLDREYVDNISLKLDLFIIRRTFSVIRHGEEKYL